MENKDLSKIVGGALIADEEKNIDIPDKKAIAMSALDMFLNGEMSISLEECTVIKDNGKTKARISARNPRIMVSKELTAKESTKAVKQYMEEHDITSIEEIVQKQEERQKQQNRQKQKSKGMEMA